jgi:hypothetical protein
MSMISALPVLAEEWIGAHPSSSFAFTTPAAASPPASASARTT